MVILKEIESSLENCKLSETISLVTMAVEENYSTESIIREGLYTGIMASLKKYHNNEILIPDFLTAERALTQSIKVLHSSIQNENNPQWGKVITGTLQGDIREWEKNIISVLIQCMGINVIDLGVSVSIESFIKAAIEEDVRIIVCSTSLTTHLPQMKYLARALGTAKLRDRVKLLFSGGPVTELFCRNIGADFYAPDPLNAAETAVDYCKREPNFLAKQAV
jgi:5-methyltetrahydrofolate--homocysteine methyltransferase